MRVLDLTWVLAGPQATTVLADFGAQVIRVESRTHPDLFRRGYGPFADNRRGPDLGGKFNNLNRNKLSVTLDLARDEGKALFRRLVALADVVAENFTAGVMAKWGFDYDGLRAVNPAIIYLSMAGLGHYGPHSAHRTYGPTVQALSGLTYLGGLPGREPSGWGYSYMDHTAGHYGALAVLMALYERRRSGLGQHIDLAQLDAAATLTGVEVPRFLATGQPSAPPGNDAEDGVACPHGVFPCLGDDRWLAVAVESDAEWRALCQVIGRPDMAADPALALAPGRRARRDEVEAVLAAWTRQQEPHAATLALQAAGVKAGAVQNAADLIESDPQLREFGLFPELDHPEIGRFRFEGAPLQLSRTTAALRTSAPLLGEHNRYVFLGLVGLAEQELSDLEGAGVV